MLAFLGNMAKWGFGFLLLLVFLVWTGLLGKLPSEDDLRNVENAVSTEVYSVDSVLIGKYFIENRTQVSLKDISPHVINALIATEDRRFFEHEGIDFQSWKRIAWGVVTRKESLGGGSTLSQQLAKNLYPRKNYYVPGVSILINKIRENFISIRLEKVYTKDDLLNLYLNTVPFGGDIFGINIASKFYFNKKAKDLSPDQAATLVGMLKATTKYNPIRNPENAKSRRNVVLRQMVVNKHLTEKEFEELSVKPVGAKKNSRESHNEGTATYFREHLRNELVETLKSIKKEDGTSYNLYTDGLKIYTTIHSKMQQYAEEAVTQHMQTLQKQFDDHWKNYKKEKPWGEDKWIDEQVRKNDRYEAAKAGGKSDTAAYNALKQPVKMTIFSWKGGGTEVDTMMTPFDSIRYYFCLLNCGFMAMDHHNGYVRAWVGGTNFKYFKYDHVKSSRQVGSTFKPIVYAAAVQDSIKPCDYFENSLFKIKDWEPHNADERYGGWYSVAGALENSVNVIAARLIDKVGMEKTIQLAKKMGVTSTLPREAGISLGAADISLYDMIKVYGTIANKGIRPDPVYLLKIVDRDGNVIYDYKAQEKENPTWGKDTALTVEQAAIMTKMMQTVIDSGTGSRFRKGYGILGDFAGKTGTSQNQSDGWFICFNPQLVTGSWVGGEFPVVRFRSMYLGQGSSSALPIVAMFWHKVANDKKLGRLLWDKFKDPGAYVNSMFGCRNRIYMHPDSLALLKSDSTENNPADTAKAGIVKKLKEGLSDLLKKEDKDKKEQEKQQKKDDLENRRDERREKRKEFFDKLNDKKEKGR